MCAAFSSWARRTNMATSGPRTFRVRIALLAPSSPYAVSRVAQEPSAPSLRVAVPWRSFERVLYTGKRRGAVFAKFVRPADRRDRTGTEPPRSSRSATWTPSVTSRMCRWIRPTCSFSMSQRGVGGAVYNVCSGKGVAMREILNALVAQSRIKVEVHVDPSRLRPSDLPVLIGDPSRLREATGFLRPRATLARSPISSPTGGPRSRRGRSGGPTLVKVLVTGGAGFLGRNVVCRRSRAPGTKRCS